MRNTFIPNYWYVAEYSENVGRKLLPITIMNLKIVLYRREDGVPVALEDSCPHRRLPLSKGALIGDQVQCGYHGLEFDHLGRCVKIPGESQAVGSAKVRRYPIEDRHGFVWIWMGDARLANVNLIPEYGNLKNGPVLRGERLEYNRLACNYILAIDNLLDLSHLAYVHAKTTGNPYIAERGNVHVEKLGNDRVRVKRSALNIVPPKTFAEFGGYKENIDVWMVSEFILPCFVLASFGSDVAGHGMPEGDAIFDQGRWGYTVYHALTPETERSTHHLRYVRPHPKDIQQQSRLDGLHKTLEFTVQEDVDVYSAQQRGLDEDPEGADAWDIKTRTSIAGDKGFLQARLLLRKKLLGESEAA